MLKLISALFSLIYLSTCENHQSKISINNLYDSIITINVNQQFSIDLIATSDYSWKFKDMSFESYITYNQQRFKTLKNLPGSNGIQTFYFTAKKKGETQIEFIFVRPYIKPYPEEAKKKYYKIIIN